MKNRLYIKKYVSIYLKKRKLEGVLQISNFVVKYPNRNNLFRSFHDEGLNL